MAFFEYPPYVPVAERRAQAEKHRREQAKKGIVLRPVKIEGRVIASSFWGRAWCDNLESYADAMSRLPRGRTYARNGSVVDLAIERGVVRAQVMGSSLYRVEVTVEPLAPRRWRELVDRCAREVGSVVEVLQGKLPKTLLETLADRSSGLFPAPDELGLDCSCPDGVNLCKHLAAVLYGVGARLDHEPETFFVLRGVEVTELAARGAGALATPGNSAFADDELANLFGIEIDAAPAAGPVVAAGPRKKRPAPAPTAKTKTVAKAKPPASITSAELAARGLSGRTIASWVKKGWLGAPDAKARYRLTAEARSELGKRAGRTK